MKIEPPFDQKIIEAQGIINAYPLKSITCHATLVKATQKHIKNMSDLKNSAIFKKACNEIHSIITGDSFILSRFHISANNYGFDSNFPFAVSYTLLIYYFVLVVSGKIINGDI